MSQVFVFDHDHATLEVLALTLDAAVVKIGDDTEAVKELLGKTWLVALVHIDPKPWKMLCDGISDRRVLIRFSSEGYPPMPPQGETVLAMHCVKKTSELKEGDILALATTCSQDGVIDELRDGYIPRSIDNLIAFVEPHRLRALHILLQGVLAVWASDPRHLKDQQEASKHHQDAAKLLGVVTIPAVLTKEIAQMAVLRRGLGLIADPLINAERKKVFRAEVLKELGLRKFTGAPDIGRLIDHVLDSTGEDIDPEIALSGFKEVDRFLCRQ